VFVYGVFTKESLEAYVKDFVKEGEILFSLRNL
jgi:hypothetical protein